MEKRPTHETGEAETGDVRVVHVLAADGGRVRPGRLRVPVHRVGGEVHDGDRGRGDVSPAGAKTE
jgi:hypothetical protein